jgi:hypothetical protein
MPEDSIISARFLESTHSTFRSISTDIFATEDFRTVGGKCACAFPPPDGFPKPVFVVAFPPPEDEETATPFLR